MEQINIIQIIVTALVSAIVAGCLTYIGVIKTFVKSLKNGVLAVLRMELIRCHDRCQKKHCCPIYEREALSKAYDAYHNLGGNGAMTAVYNETMALPTEKAE